MWGCGGDVHQAGGGGPTTEGGVASSEGSKRKEVIP